ncbi:MAG: DUF2723 domain-containing protein [Nonlabens sp.]
MKTPEIYSGVLMFITVFTIYTCTCAGYVSFWDSPEFTTANVTLQSTHPPGSPLYTIIGAFATSFFDVSQAALISNLLSSFFGALCCLLLYLVIIKFIKSVFNKWSRYKSIYMPVVGGLLGAFTLAFSDTFWVASTEAEVYTLSFFIFLALIYTSILWYESASYVKRFRLAIFYFFLLGCAVGVHMLILVIIIPTGVLAIGSRFRESVKKYLLGLLLGILSFVVIYMFFLQGGITLLKDLEIFMVNSLGFAQNSSLWFIAVILSSLLLSALIVSFFKKWYKLEVSAWCFLFFLIGLSPYLTAILRSDAHFMVAPEISNPLRLNDYFKAKQFGVDEIPLITGPVYNAPLDSVQSFKNVDPIYAFNQGKYEIIDSGVNGKVNYANSFTQFFPRLYNAVDSTRYKSWTHIEGVPLEYTVQGDKRVINKPTFGENLEVFFNYQAYWLNLRYLFWNFVGRQNTHHGLGDVRNGNWESGWNFIDKSVTGPFTPEKNLGQSHLFGLPLLLGILGLLSLWRNRLLFVYSILVFLAFGIGITLYVNPVPSSLLVRERDYIFIGSYIIYALWIGCSVIIIAFVNKKYKVNIALRYVLVAILAVAVPFQMLFKGYSNHDRTNDSFAYHFAKASLDSCPKNAVLVTNGDNMTFPLFYMQQVLHYRDDVRIINYDMLNIDTHIEKLKKRFLNSDGLTITLDRSTYINGTEKLFPLNVDTQDAVDLSILSKFIQNKPSRILWNNRKRNYIPSVSFSVNVDSTRFLKRYPSIEYGASYVNEITWKLEKDFYGLGDVVLMNLIENNLGKRPICFFNNGRNKHKLGLNSYLIQRGMVSELVPLIRSDKNKNPKIVDLETSEQVVFESLRPIDFANNDMASQSINVEYAKSILRQQYYFLAQAQFENGKTSEAIETLDLCLKRIPNKNVPFNQYAFAIGKLYARCGAVKKGREVCGISMRNIGMDLEQILSFDPPNSIINAKFAVRLRNMFNQMYQQYPADQNGKPYTLKFMQTSQKGLEQWLVKNYPYKS